MNITDEIAAVAQASLNAQLERHLETARKSGKHLAVSPPLFSGTFDDHDLTKSRVMTIRHEFEMVEPGGYVREGWIVYDSGAAR